MSTDTKDVTSAANQDDSITMIVGMRVLLPFAKVGKVSYLISALLATFSTLAQLGPYWVAYRAVVSVVDGSATQSSLLRLAGLAAIFVITEYLLFAISTWMSHRAAFTTLEQLRLSIGDQLGHVPLGFITRRRSGEMQRTISDDVERLELFLAHAIPDLFSSFVALVSITIWLFVIDWRMALASLAVLVICIPIMGYTASVGQDSMVEYHRSLNQMNGSIVEFVKALPIVRTFNRTEETFTETRNTIDYSATMQATWGRKFLTPYTVFLVLIVSNVVTIVPIGLWLYHINWLERDHLIFFFIVGLGYLISVTKLFELTEQLTHLTLAANMVLELDKATALPEPDHPATIADSRIVVDSVGFSHIPVGTDDAPRRVLDEISFVAEPGTVTALVGPSGSGKSTLAKLLCRFWDVEDGSISIGGADLRSIPSQQLMDQIAFVFQETFLFDDTIAGNLRIGKPDATDAEVVAAARAAQAHDFITALPDGYETRLGERGARLSGGERQRLAIARALLKDAPIVILDEATAYADPENEAALQDALVELIQGRTLVIIAHRLSTISGADQILVLDTVDGGPGTIVERGTHAELLADEGLYQRMWTAAEATEQVALGDAVHGGDKELS